MLEKIQRWQWWNIFFQHFQQGSLSDNFFQHFQQEPLSLYQADYTIYNYNLVFQFHYLFVIKYENVRSRVEGVGKVKNFLLLYFFFLFFFVYFVNVWAGDKEQNQKRP